MTEKLQRLIEILSPQEEKNEMLRMTLNEEMRARLKALFEENSSQFFSDQRGTLHYERDQIRKKEKMYHIFLHKILDTIIKEEGNQAESFQKVKERSQSSQDNTLAWTALAAPGFPLTPVLRGSLLKGIPKTKAYN